MERFRTHETNYYKLIKETTLAILVQEKSLISYYIFDIDRILRVLLILPSIMIIRMLTHLD